MKACPRRTQEYQITYIVTLTNEDEHQETVCLFKIKKKIPAVSTLSSLSVFIIHRALAGIAVYFDSI